MNKGKWTKFTILEKVAGLKAHLPETKRFNEINFWLFMNKYQDVIVKPIGGEGGRGIIRVTRLGMDRYQIHSGNKRSLFKGRKWVFHYLRKILNNNHNIVQQRIPLATYKGRPLDIRVMVQRRMGSPWTVTGKLVKVAGPGFIITNTARSKGFVLPFTDVAGKEVENEIDRISILAAQTLSGAYKGLRQVGMDIALDSNGRVWIIECNFAPASSLFLRLKDKTMYRRIVTYYKK